jgi:hypothetical protein
VLNAHKVIATAMVGFALLAGASRPAFAGALDSIPIDPKAKTLQEEQTVAVPAKRGSGANISVPGRGVFAIDFAVEGNKQLLLILLTNDQYNSALAGRKASGDPLMRTTIEGTASQTIMLDRGDYYVFLGNDAATDTNFTYRATWRRI